MLQSSARAALQDGVHPLDAADCGEWERYARSATRSTFFHLPGWARVIERTWGHTPHHIGVARAGHLVGIMPLFHVRSRLFGSMLVSSPNAVYGGAIADDAAAYRALVAEAKALARHLHVDYLDLRDQERMDGTADQELLQRALYVSFEHPISPDSEQLGRTLPRDVRRMIRQGHKHGLVALLGRDECIDEFYDVYATSVRNLGTPVFPRRFFLNLLDEFATASDILLIRRGQMVAGAVMSFYFRDVVMPYYGGAYPEFYPLGVNNFMYWELMQSAAARGYRRFDFGRSKTGTGACAFKRGWAMKERALPYRYYLVRSTAVPDLNPLNPRIAPLTRLWKALPVPVTKIVGPLIVRGLP